MTSHTADRSRAAAPVARAVAACLAVVMLLTGCKFGGVHDLPLPGGADTGKDPYTIEVEFLDVLDLVPRSAVKVGDVAVGQVTEVRLDGWHARVTVELQRTVRLPDNARAAVQQTSLLGEKYVQLAEPTTEQARGRLADGDLIPLSRTQRAAEVEEVLSALAMLLNGGGLPQLRTINKELNAALSGREDKVKSVIKELDTFVGGLDEQKDNIDKALRNIDKLSRQLKKQQPTINTTLRRMPPALKILTDQRKDLVVLLKELSKLGKVGTRVINASRDDTIANLKALRPILTKLAEAGTDLPNALAMMLTYPFPPNAADAAIGDYTNLHLTADLNLAQILQVVGDGGPAPPPDLEQLDELLEQVNNQTQGPRPDGLLPSGMVPPSDGDGGKAGSTPTPSSSGKAENDDLLRLLLGGVGGGG
ncbi:MAG: MCE family protein [Streptosporangiales bacterium]|nr:MCE family protein [Streptosporangiales bacterium]